MFSRKSIANDRASTDRLLLLLFLFVPLASANGLVGLW